MDSYGDGWNGGYYSIFTSSGDDVFGGTLNDGKSGTNHLCLAPGECFYMMLLARGEAATEISYSVCGVTADASGIVEICTSSAAPAYSSASASAGDGSRCSARLLSQVPNPSCASNNINLLMFAANANGWGDVSYKISPKGSSIRGGSKEGSLGGGFYAMDQLCLEDGCYSFTVDGSSSSSSSALAATAATAFSPLANKYQNDIFWSACGHLGLNPWNSTVCVEKAHGFCYGINNCPVLRSYLYHRDLQVIYTSQFALITMKKSDIYCFLTLI
jgi:hypothetical protein